MAPPKKSTLLGLLLCTVATTATGLPGQKPAAPATAKRLHKFASLSAKRQEKVLATVKAAIHRLQDPYLEAIKLLAWQSRLHTKPRIEKLPPKSKSRTGKGDFVMPFPITREYVFGVGIIVPVGGLYSPAELKGSKKGRRRKTRTRKTTPAKARTEAQRVAELRSWLTGWPPDLDLALAVLLYRLDKDTGADRFFAFLESWRNNEESFYQALDRTAGTPDSVFFFDAMLSEFVRRFVPKGDSPYAYIRMSLETSHDALHKSFLSYRQYRAFREAAAFSLLLPPGIKLPPTLSRYQQKPKSGYSLRQQMLMLLALHKQNPGEVVTLIAKGADPMPVPLWAKTYSPYPAYNRDYTTRLKAMAALAGTTDALLAKQEKYRLDIAAKVSDKTKQELDRLGVR